jgi:DNA-binding IclR family transcriptional regulator
MDACIPSLEQLEVLLWLRRHGHGTARELARVLATTHDSIARRLAHLMQMNLISTAGDEVRYSPPPALGQLVDRLAVEYSERRLQVISHLYGRSQGNPAQAFSDAFNLRPRPRPPQEDA